MKFFGQPRALYLLFFTELWERFGFYMIQALIVLYMSERLHLSDDQTYALYTVFGSLVYLTPIAGGYLAERYLGYQKSILFGGLLLALGYMIMALPGYAIFFVGLSFIIIGNGLFKPNVSSVVSLLYDHNDARREGGYTLFYIGINLGSLASSFSSGIIVHFWGWHAGFWAAAIGMWISVALFYFGRQKYLQGHGVAPRQGALTFRESRIFYRWFYPLVFLTIALVFLAFLHTHFMHFLFNSLAIFVVCAVMFLACKQTTEWRYKMWASLILIVLSMGFWAIYNQMFSSMMLFASRNMVLHLGPIPITPQLTQFFNPFFVILMGAGFSMLWGNLGKRGLNPSYPLKFALSFVSMFLGYFILAVVSHGSFVDSLISPVWVMVTYFFVALGELLLSPIGLSMITVLTPPKWVGMMIGVWFFSIAESYQFTDWLARLASIPKNLSPAESLAVYHHAFVIYSIVALFLCAVAFSLIPLVQKLMRK